jgi:hypothetical protein
MTKKHSQTLEYWIKKAKATRSFWGVGGGIQDVVIGAHKDGYITSKEVDKLQQDFWDVDAKRKKTATLKETKAGVVKILEKKWK